MIIDLFSGVGGFTLGARLAGLKVGVAVDFDGDLTSTHTYNFADIRHLRADLTHTTPQQILRTSSLDGVDISGIVGGPPCQGFSNIGRRVSGDPRNTLVMRFFEFVRQVRPGFFVFENVPGLLTDRFFPVLEAALNEVPDDYDVVGPLIVNAKDFGAATDRARVVVLGVPPGSGSTVEKRLLATEGPVATVAEAIDDLPSLLPQGENQSGYGWQALSNGKSTPLSRYAQRLRAAPKRGWVAPFVLEEHRAGRVSGFKATVHSSAVVRRFRNIRQGASDPVSKFPRLHADRPAPTLRAGTGRDKGCYQAVRPIHPHEPRVITVREAARLQGFPDWFLFHETKWHSFRMIGNSIPPSMARALIELCASQL